LKAYIIRKGIACDKVYDLLDLLKNCSAFEPAFGELKEYCIFLNTAYLETRYPVHWPTSYTKETAERAYTAAVNIARIVRNKLALLGVCQ
jgi:HEPN domain-containing protein